MTSYTHFLDLAPPTFIIRLIIVYEEYISDMSSI